MESLLLFARRHAAFVFGMTAVAALSGVLLVSRVSFDANILRLLPQRLPSVREFQLFLSDFGSLDHLYVIFTSTDSIDAHSELVDWGNVDALRRAPEIQSVDAQLFEPSKDWTYLSERELYLLGTDGASSALARFRAPQLDAELAHTRDLLSMPSPQIKELVQRDPLGLLALLRDRMSREKGFVSFDATREGYVSPDGHSRLLLVKPSEPPFNTDFCKALFQRLASVEAAARQSTPEDSEAGAVRIQPAGSYRISLEAEQLIRHESIVNSVGSLLLLLFFGLVVLRTPWMMIYGSAPLGVAALLTLGVNGLVKSNLSPATSGSAGMLFGLGIDGVVLLYLRYLEERRAGANPDEAVSRLGPTASSVVLAQLTTAATFLALLFIDFPTLQDLGSLVGLGILFCCGLTLLLIPALLPRRDDGRPRRELTAAWLSRFVSGAARSIVWGSALATIALGVAATRLSFDTSIDKLQALTPGTLFEREVAARFSLPQDVLLVLDEHPDIEALLETDARLQRTLAIEAPAVAVSSVGVLLPSAREQAQVAQLIRTAGTTSAVVQRDLQAAAARVGFRPTAFDPFLEAVPRLLDPDARITYDGLLAHGLGSILSRFVVRRNDRYEAVTYLYPQQAVDIDQLARIIFRVDPSLRLTGLPVIDHDVRRAFAPQFLKGLAIGTVAIGWLIYLVFRTVRHTILALLPTLVGFVWSAGVLALFRVRLDLFSAFAAVTFIGIAVDYGIYVLYRYVFESPHDMDRVLRKTGAAILIAGTTALLGFGTLINSSYGPLHTFGVVSVVTLSCCLTASVVTLPALVLELAPWLRSNRAAR